MLRQAFPERGTAEAVAFADVYSEHWAKEAIAQARSSGFLAGYPNNRFRPEQDIPRVQVLVALSNGLGYVARPLAGGREILSYFRDAAQIPDYATNSIRAATQSGIVVSYPSVTQLNPNRNATRGEVAAFVYQVLAKEGRLPAIAAAPYVVEPSFSTWPTQPNRVIPATGRVEISGMGTRVLTAQPEGFQVWATETGAKVSEVALGDRRLDANNPSVNDMTNDIAINASGTRIAAAATTLNASSNNPQLVLHLWDADTGALLWQTPVSDAVGQPRENLGFTEVRAVAFRPGDDAVLVYLHRKGSAAQPEAISLQLHDLQTGTGSLYLEDRLGLVPRKVAFSPDGTKLVGYRQLEQDGGFNSQIIDIWPFDQPEPFAPGTLGESIVLPKSQFGFVDLVFTPKGSLRSLSQNFYDIRLDDWNLELGQRLQSVRDIGDVDRTDTLGLLSPDGEYYFVRSDVAGTRLINTKTYGSISLSNIVRDAAFDGRGEVLAIATPTQTEIFRKVVE